jgi:hypothetical protein
MAEPRELTEYQTDHDLLVGLHTLVKEAVIPRLDKFDNEFVTRTEFWPVKVLVFGCAGMMLTGVIGALLYLVIKH